MPKKTKRADIVVGIPSYNESDSIRFVTQQVDKGLKKFRKNYSTLIINGDNNSPDGTKNVFLKTQTSSPKEYIGTKQKGKGINVINIFKRATKLDAKIVMLFDADLTSITPAWVTRYTNTILKRGYDFGAPFYVRNKFDGSITNHICYPLITALFSVNIRQPIGGDFALSGNLAKYIASKKWPEEILEYGIDILLTVSVIIQNKKIAQVYLGTKEHKPSLLKLDSMYSEVTSSLFSLLNKYKKSWQGGKLQNPPLLYNNKKITAPEAGIDKGYLKTHALHEFDQHFETIKKIFPKKTYKALEKEYLDKKSIKITQKMWLEIMSVLFKESCKGRKCSREVIDAGKAFFLGRHFSFAEEMENATNGESEEAIKKQAQYFHRNRDKF